MAIAGLDIGSTGCKCTIFNQEGSVSSYSYFEYSLEVGKYGYLELNPHTVWKAVCNVCKEANQENKGNPVEALCITSFGEAGVLVDKKGRELYNSMMYTDPRGQEQCQRLIDKLGEAEIQSRSGHSPHPMFSASKLMWLKDNEPEIFKQSKTFLQYSDYILFKLSNEKFVDWSLASRTLMFNVIDKSWDSVLLDAAGLDVDLFPEAVRTGKIVAKISKEATELTGFPKGMLLLLGGQDQIGAAVGGGALKAGQAVNGMGSVDCITPVFDKPIINKTMGKSGYACVPYVLPDHYVTYAFNFSSGSLLKWFRDNFGKEAVLEGEEKGVSPYYLMDSKVSSEPTGILVMPHWQGAATPYMDVNSVGAIIGIDMSTDNNKLYKSLMEGVAYEMKTNILCLADAGVDIQRITTCGGGSKSKVWMQIRADIFGMPIDVLEVEEAGTLGAAVMAGCASGWYKDLSDGVDQLVRIKKTYYPDSKNHQRYVELYEKYKLIYESVKKIKNR